VTIRKNVAIHERDWKRCIAEGLQEPGYAWVLCEGTRFLREIEPLYLRSFALDPLKVADQTQQIGVDAWAADAGRTTHRRVVNVYRWLRLIIWQLRCKRDCLGFHECEPLD